MQYAIQIPKPCNESWADMTAVTNGRHCDQCSKTVIDFTNWDNAEIVDYLQKQGANKTCGRFRNEQLANVHNDTLIYSVTSSAAPFYSKLAAIFLLAFGLIQMSCNTGNRSNIPAQQNAVSTDTVQNATNTTTMGEPKIPKTENEYHTMGKAAVKIKEDKKYLKGDVCIEPIDSAKRKTNTK